MAFSPEICARAVDQAGVMCLDDIDRLDGVNGINDVDGRGLVGAHPRVSRRRRPDGDRVRPDVACSSPDVGRGRPDFRRWSPDIGCRRLDAARWSPDVVHRRRTSCLGPVD